MNIGIIGLGLMGGSLAKAVKRYGIASKVYGFTNSEKNKNDILQLNLVDELVDLETLKKVSDVIILAIPVDAIIGMFPNFLDIDENTYLILVQRYKELPSSSGSGGNIDIPFEIEGYITEIDTDKIDTDFMNSRFDKYRKIIVRLCFSQLSLISL